MQLGESVNKNWIGFGIVALVLIGVFVFFGGVQFSVVGGLDAPVMMQIQEYDSKYGAVVTVAESRGTYKNYEKEWVGAYTYRIWFRGEQVTNYGWSEQLCKDYGGSWTTPDCYFPSDVFSKIGIENLEITKSTLHLSCTADFGTRTPSDIIIKGDGFWFKGIEENLDEFTPEQLLSAQNNYPCVVSGSIWVKIKPPCVPDWQCTAWEDCKPGGTQVRVCEDSNACAVEEGKPAETQECVYIPTEQPTEEPVGEEQPVTQEPFSFAQLLLIGSIIFIISAGVVYVVVRTRR